MERQLTDLICTEGAFANPDIPDTPAQLIAVLEAVALQETTLGGTGPRLLGSIDDISKPMSIKKLASLYACAARQGERIYPYFEAAVLGIGTA